MGEQSLIQIVERCQHGDKQAFGHLYTAMHDRLRDVCRRFTADDAMAEDLLHDSFVLIISKIGTLKDTSKAESWMTTVTRNLAQAWLKQQKKATTVSLDELQSPLEEETPIPMPVSYEEILHLVDALPESYRRVFRLSVFENLSHQEIADMLKIEPHTSSSELSRAKLLLRRWLRPMVFLLVAAVLPLGWLWWKNMQRPNTLVGDVGQTAKPSQLNSREAVAGQTLGQTDNMMSTQKEYPTALGDTSRVVALDDSHRRVSEPTVTEQEPLRDSETDSIGRKPLRGSETDVTKQIPLRGSQPDMTIGNTIPDTRVTVDLAYSGVGSSDGRQLPYADADTNDDVYDSVAHHRMPLTVTLSVGYRLDRHWQVGLGLQYIRLTSEMQSGNTYTQFVRQQRVQYLGLPLSVRWYYPLTRRLGTYATANVTMQLPLHSTLDSRYVLNGAVVETTTESLRPGLQWSAGVGLGLQYDLSPTVGFFVEPSLQYHFRNGSGVETWQTEHPAALYVPFGLRITF